MRLLNGFALSLAAILLLAAPAAAQKSDLEKNLESPGKTQPLDKKPMDKKPMVKKPMVKKPMVKKPMDKQPGDGVTPPMGQITGVWVVTGANGRGQTYRGAAAVRRVGDVYRVVWRIGRSTYWGVGILTGRVFSVGYKGGLAVYQVTPAGMVGRWTTIRGTRILGENWRRR
jgi:hypothetical protein